MLAIEQFKKIQELKEIGVSKLKVSEKLNLSYKTVCNLRDGMRLFQFISISKWCIEHNITRSLILLM